MTCKAMDRVVQVMWHSQVRGHLPCSAAHREQREHSTSQIMHLTWPVTGNPEVSSRHVPQALCQHAADSDVAVTAAVLGTLSRVASACARLHLRDEVLATPDIVLSIMLLEESFRHQVIRSRPACSISLLIGLLCLLPGMDKGPRAWRPTELGKGEVPSYDTHNPPACISAVPAKR